MHENQGLIVRIRIPLGSKSCGPHSRQRKEFFVEVEEVLGIDEIPYGADASNQE